MSASGGTGAFDPPALGSFPGSSSSSSAFAPPTAGSGAGAGSGTGASKRARRGIQWDEPTIAEHDKERGTRKKILEPKTPYRPPRDLGSSANSVGSVASDAEDADALRLNDPRIAAALAGHWDSGSESESHGASRGGAGDG
jgi:hypothetical protein